MALSWNNFAFLVIIFFLSLVSCYSSHVQRDSGNNNYYLQQEDSGYDFQAYPTYFSTIESVKSQNDSSKLETNGQFFYFKKSPRRLAASVKTINVENYEAQGDGESDDTKAFEEAWKEVCSSTVPVNFVIPKMKTYLLRTIWFSGPCKSDITMQIGGTLLASDDLSDYSKDSRHWLIFDNVQGLMVQGGGIVDGNGKIWWENSCKINKEKPCTAAPTALTFYKCKNLVVKNLKIQNAQKIQVSFERCKNVQASNLMITAPEDSPNTDGIHVTATQNIQISSSVIGTGDDCISIVSGSRNVQAYDITCGPGHGISIGSLGSGNSEEYVSDVVVNGAKLTGTTNGVRIKTWQGGSGRASNIKFQNVEMQNVTNPIIINQNYCDQSEPCKKQSNAVQVKNVVYQNIKGTSASEIAIDFDCSETHPCQGIVLQNVNLEGIGGAAVKARCNNVNFKTSGTVYPPCP